VSRRLKNLKKKKVYRKNGHQNRAVQMMVLFVCVCLAFVLGFFARGNSAFLDRLGMGLQPSQETNPGQTVSGSTYNSLSARVAEVQGILSDDSMDSFDLDDATNNVLRAVSTSTHDNYVRYYDSQRYQDYIKDISGHYAGVGILFGDRDGQAYAVDVFPESEAASKDVESGDILVAIDGDRGNNGWTYDDAVRALARDEGENVALTFRRPNNSDSGNNTSTSSSTTAGQEFTVNLTCSTYSEPNVTTAIDENNVGYIRVSQITANSSSLVRQALTDLRNNGAQCYVLDLRDNPGGYLTQTVDIASLFIRDGAVCSVQSQTGTSERDVSGQTVTDAPIAVLVNNNTAGSAEVLAGALQDSGRATVVGVTTQGKGSIQSMQELSFGGALRYTSGYFYTPRGHQIDGVGIRPDVVIDNDSTDTDNQRQMADGTVQALVNQ